MPSDTDPIVLDFSMHFAFSQKGIGTHPPASENSFLGRGPMIGADPGHWRTATDVARSRYATCLHLDY
jgi:hypothetical protein